MWNELMYIFLDESGDLGFHFKPNTSKHFVLTSLVIQDLSTVRLIKFCIGKVLKKINRKRNVVNELKGSSLPLKWVKYFFEKIIKANWYLNTVIIDKTNFLIPNNIKHIRDLYDYVAMHLFINIPVKDQSSTIIVSIDRCKTKKEIMEFNRQLRNLFQLKLNNASKLIINHENSHEIKLLQAVDLLCYGIFSKYEYGDCSKYNCFRNKIREEKILIE